MTITTIQGADGPHPQFNNQRIAQFLHRHLDEFGDPIEDILKCLDYVFTKGGLIKISHEKDDIQGVVVLNDTGMSGYIPEHILVYIAVDASLRGQGTGGKLMQAALKAARGNVALHVEPNNPARRLYERLGFTNKYLEMRYDRTKDTQQS